MQHFIGRYSRYSRYRTKTHDKSTISHVFPRYSRYQTVLLKLQEIIKIFSKRLSFGWAFYFDFLERTALPRILITPLELRPTKRRVLSFELKTVHRTVFFTLSQFTRDNFDLWSNTKNAQLMMGIFYYLFDGLRSNEICLWQNKSITMDEIAAR